MASPQKENGYTPIANELLEAICRFPFSGSQLRIVLFLMRKTYGWSKKWDNISCSQFAIGTGLNPRTVKRELKKLESMNVINNTRSGHLTTPK